MGHTLGLGAFAVASLGHYLYVAISAQVITKIPVFGHLWRIGFLLLIGAVINMAVARLAVGSKDMKLAHS